MITVLKGANPKERKDSENPNAAMAVSVTIRGLVAVPLDLPRQYAPEEIHNVHEVLIESLRDEVFDENDRARLHRTARELVNRAGLQYSNSERDEFATQVVDEVIGHGPIEALIREDRITDIMINGPKEIFCEVDGINQRVPVTFRDEDHLNHVISRIVSAVGRRVDESSPIVDARLKDGSRVNVILPPLSLKGPAVSIRKFGTHKIRGKELIEKKSITSWMLEFLEAAVETRINVIVSGGAGAGKTTLLNTLSLAIPNTERIVTIEDSAELQISQANVVPLETRPPNLEGKGEIPQGALVRNALRMKPDRIIIGECRGAEAFDMLQAMNTGHEGSLTTIHANSPREAMSRLQNMILMGKMGMAEQSIKEQIASARPIIVQVMRHSDGTRRITHISEVVGAQGSVISMQDIFSFESKGIDIDGVIHGSFVGQGIVPQCMGKIKLAGRDFEPGFWQQKMEV